MKSFTKNMFVFTAVAAAAFALVVCGGGGCGGGGEGGGEGGGTTGATSAPAISAGTMTKGSVILNGNRFEDTAYEGGLGTDLANDVKVEAEGHFQGTTLVADKIKFKDSVRFESNVESKTPDRLTGRSFKGGDLVRPPDDRSRQGEGDRQLRDPDGRGSGNRVSRFG